MRLKQCLWILAAGAVFSACQQQGGKTAAAEGEQGPAVLQADLSGEFYDSLRLAMNAYYQLSGALVKADTLAADMAAAALKYHLDSLPVARLEVDSTRQDIIQGSAGDIAAELDGMLMEKGGLDARRASFQMVSDQLYDLLHNTGLKGSTVYRQHCPMAFGDRGAYWLSDKTEVLNPYFGDEMLHCGSVTDTLHYQ